MMHYQGTYGGHGNPHRGGYSRGGPPPGTIMPPGAAIAMLDGHDASSLSEVPGDGRPGAGDDRGGGTSSASVGGGSTGAPASSSKSGGKKAKADRAKSRGGYRCGKVSRVIFYCMN